MKPKSPERAQAFLDGHGDRLRSALRKDASRKLPAAAQLDQTPRSRSFNQMPFLSVPSDALQVAAPALLRA